MRLLFLCLFLTGCATSDGVLLRWKVDSSKQQVYQTAINDIVPFNDSGLVLAHGFDIFSDPELRERVKNSLASYQQPTAKHSTSIGVEKNHLRVEVTGIIPQYLSELKTENERMLRELTQMNDGRFVLVGDIDQSGELLSFYLQQKQKNIMSLLFNLPKGKVHIGDSWEIPQDLIDIGTNYFPDKLDRVNKVFLDDIVQLENGQLVAKLFYVISEKVTGQFEYGHTDKKIPSDVAGSFLAYGEFNINSGGWEKFTGVSYFTGKGNSVNEALSIYGLTPIEPPDKQLLTKETTL